MAETLATFIVRRLSEVASEESDLRATLRTLEAEQEQLRRAAEAAGIAIPDDVLTALDDALDDPFPVHKRKVSERTIKEVVLEILKESRRPMTALEILPVINDRLNADYPRSSLSPQLSRLKADGLIDREGRNWTLALPGSKKEEAADANPPERTPTASDEDDPARDLLGPPTPDRGPQAAERQVVHEKIDP